MFTLTAHRSRLAAAGVAGSVLLSLCGPAEDSVWPDSLPIVEVADGDCVTFDVGPDTVYPAGSLVVFTDNVTTIELRRSSSDHSRIAKWLYPNRVYTVDPADLAIIACDVIPVNAPGDPFYVPTWSVTDDGVVSENPPSGTFAIDGAATATDPAERGAPVVYRTAPPPVPGAGYSQALYGADAPGR